MSRYSRRPHCAVCGLRGVLCICDSLEAIRLPWRLWILQHHREHHKPTNTARLLAHLVDQTPLELYARPDQPWAPQPLADSSRRIFVLFPGPDSRVVDQTFLNECAVEPTTLLLLDATWRQASRMVRRAPLVCDLPRITLPEGAESTWPTRRAFHPGQLSTLETMVRLATLAGLASGKSLLHAHQSLVAAQTANRFTPAGLFAADSVANRPTSKP